MYIYLFELIDFVLKKIGKNINQELFWSNF